MTFIATVGYVRSHKISRLVLHCEGKRQGGYPCCHGGMISIAGMPDDMTIARIASRVVCTACGSIGNVDARPDWAETSLAASGNMVR